MIKSLLLSVIAFIVFFNFRSLSKMSQFHYNICFHLYINRSNKRLLNIIYHCILWYKLITSNMIKRWSYLYWLTYINYLIILHYPLQLGGKATFISLHHLVLEIHVFQFHHHSSFYIPFFSLLISYEYDRATNNLMYQY